MRSVVVVVVIPGKQGEISFRGVAPVSGVSPFAQGGLDEALGFAVGLRGVGAGAAVLEAQLLAGAAKLVGAIAAAIIGEQSAHADTVAGEELHRLAQKSDRGVGLLIGQDLGEGQARVIVDGNMQGLPTRMRAPTPTAAIAAPAYLLEAGHTLDIEVQQVSGSGAFVAHDGRPGMQIAPATEASAPQNAADGGRTDGGMACDLIAGSMVTAQLNDPLDHRLG